MDELQNNSESSSLSPAGPGPRRDYILPASILIAGVMISGSIVYLVGSKNSGVNLPAAALDGKNNELAAVGAVAVQEISSRDVVLGDPKAPVAVIEYGDYQCPFCGRFFSQIEPPLRDEYIKTGKVKMAFRNLQFLGAESMAAAAAAECAKDQKQFWAYHDVLYRAEIADGEENNGNLTRNLFLKLASGLGLDAAAFTSCLDSGKYSALVADDTSRAQQAGINSTPTTFINGQKLPGAQPYAQFKAAIDNALKTK